jgi:hypothetical protein
LIYQSIITCPFNPTHKNALYGLADCESDARSLSYAKLLERTSQFGLRLSAVTAFLW